MIDLESHSPMAFVGRAVSAKCSVQLEPNLCGIKSNALGPGQPTVLVAADKFGVRRQDR